MPWLFVIARNSNFAYQGAAVDMRKVGRALGVRYLLEGSVRRAEGRLRVSGQLTDTETGAHIWAERRRTHARLVPPNAEHGRLKGGLPD